MAKQLVGMAERQSIHRHKLESEESQRLTVETSSRWDLAKCGQKNSVWLAVLALVAATIIALFGAGAAAIAVPVAIVGGVFGYFTYAQIRSADAVAPPRPVATTGSVARNEPRSG